LQGEVPQAQAPFLAPQPQPLACCQQRISWSLGRATWGR